MTTSNSTGRLIVGIAQYTAARLGLVAVIVALILGGGKVLGVSVPLLPALLFAILAALPLSLVLFRSLRTRVNTDIAALVEHRKAAREDLRARLRGGAAD